MRTFHVRIYEADRTFFEGEISSLTVPVFDGTYGVMAGHRNVVVAIVPGTLHFVTEDGTVKYASVSEGMMRIDDGDVLVLVDAAEYPEEIDEHRAEEEEAAAKEAMLQKRSLQEYVLAEASLQRAMNRLKVKHSHQTKI